MVAIQIPVSGEVKNLIFAKPRAERRFPARIETLGHHRRAARRCRGNSVSLFGSVSQTCRTAIAPYTFKRPLCSFVAVFVGGGAGDCRRQWRTLHAVIAPRENRICDDGSNLIGRITILLFACTNGSQRCN